MTLNETAAVLALMSAAWPNVEIPEHTISVWADELGGLHPDDALQAAHLLIRTSKWFPSISEFLDAARNFTRRRLETQQPAGELETGETPTAEEQKVNVRRIIAETKQLAETHRGRYRQAVRPQT